MKEAIVLLSGGLDSTTTLHLAIKKGYKCRCLIFDYDQRHKKEVLQAKKIAEKAGCAYRVIRISFPWRKGSSLLDKKAKLPVERKFKHVTRDIPSTYVPSRNTVFLGIASGWAEAVGAERIFIGANAVDFSGYPDCRPHYIEQFNRLLREGTKRGVEGGLMRIEAPLINKKKSEIVKIGSRLNVPYQLTWSCYEGGKRPCLRCDSCLLRKKGFEEAGLKDPLLE